jgi:hypothetical protein
MFYPECQRILKQRRRSSIASRTGKFGKLSREWHPSFQKVLSIARHPFMTDFLTKNCVSRARFATREQQLFANRF